MLKGFKGLFEALERHPVAPVPPPARATVAALPCDAAVPVDEQHRSAFVLEADAEHATRIAQSFGRVGLKAEVFSDLHHLVCAVLHRPPAVVMIEVGTRVCTAIDAVLTLRDRAFTGGVQLMAADDSQVAEAIRHVGERHGLRMLPILRKPLEDRTLRDLLVAEGLLAGSAATALEDALANGWMEFWYQPKIDLRRRQIAGVETLARVRHPQLGILSPAAFMAGATDGGLSRLAEAALESALAVANRFAALGINLQVAVNMPVEALLELPVADAVTARGPTIAGWRGLVLDLAAGELADSFERVAELADALRAARVQLAVDEFGRANLPLADLKRLPVAELKLDRDFIVNCADDARRSAVCGSVADLSHRLGLLAVAVGVERAVDFKVLHDVGIDLGQGYLFGHPMPEEELVDLLMKRARSTTN